MNPPFFFFHTCHCALLLAIISFPAVPALSALAETTSLFRVIPAPCSLSLESPLASSQVSDPASSMLSGHRHDQGNRRLCHEHGVHSMHDDDGSKIKLALALERKKWACGWRRACVYSTELRLDRPIDA